MIKHKTVRARPGDHTRKLSKWGKDTISDLQKPHFWEILTSNSSNSLASWVLAGESSSLYFQAHSYVCSWNAKLHQNNTQECKADFPDTETDLKILHQTSDQVASTSICTPWSNCSSSYLNRTFSVYHQSLALQHRYSGITNLSCQDLWQGAGQSAKYFSLGVWEIFYAWNSRHSTITPHSHWVCQQMTR